MFDSLLTRRVLCLNLPAAGRGWLAASLRHHAAAGEPASLTLRQLAAADPSAFAAAEVFVCENPAVVAAAADAHGAACAPLVCTAGQPGGAVRRLLRLLVEAGCTLHLHADFDLGGLRIFHRVAALVQVEPWRFGAADYEAALAGAASTPLPSTAALPPTPWSPALGPALARHRRAIHEESLLPLLLSDLASG